jgi:hypothetical protein
MLAIFATWLATAFPLCAADEKDRFLEVPSDLAINTFDLSTVQVITPGKFTIVSTMIDNPDLMRFELKALEMLRTYCARADGQYPAPTDVFTLGNPDRRIEDILVRSNTMKRSGKVYPDKVVVWEYPYKGSGLAYLPCKRLDHKEDFLYEEARTKIMNGTRLTQLFDCKRGLFGPNIDDSDPARPFLVPVTIRAAIHLLNAYVSVCRAVTHEKPYIAVPE